MPRLVRGIHRRAGTNGGAKVSRVFYVYILASAPNGTLYVGVTNDLVRRAFEHRECEGKSFTKRHSVMRLVYYEQHDTALGAITREKRLKKWPRDWKMNLIERENPHWRDLYDGIAQP
jgi:putative endonuclease